MALAAVKPLVRRHAEIGIFLIAALLVIWFAASSDGRWANFYNIASVLQVALVPVFPLEVTVPDRAFWQIPVIAVLVSLVAGGVGLRKAVSTDPALAFAGPGS